MGFLTVLTPRGAPGADLLVYDAANGRVAAVQVKTVRGNDVPLGVRATKENIDSRLAEKVRYATVVVKVGADWRETKFYVVPAEDMRRLAKEEYFRWLRDGRRRKPVEELEKSEQALAVKIKQLEPYLERWDLIWNRGATITADLLCSAVAD